MNTRHETTAQLMSRLEAEIDQRRRESETYAARPLAAAEQERREALQREADADQQRRQEEGARIARIESELDAARRQLEDERVAGIRDAVESSPASVTLATRAAADRATYGATGSDRRAADIRLESARLMEQILGVTGTYELWRLMDPTTSAEMTLYGLRWSAFHIPGEGSELRVNCGAHGPQPIPSLAELDRWADEQPALFAQIFAGRAEADEPPVPEAVTPVLAKRRRR